MLPRLSFGALALITAAACIVALCWLSFTPSALAASRFGRLYRGYVQLCIIGGERRQCGSLQTLELFETYEECGVRTLYAISQTAKAIQQTRPTVSISSEYWCRFDDSGAYDA